MRHLLPVFVTSILPSHPSHDGGNGRGDTREGCFHWVHVGLAVLVRFFGHRAVAV